MTSAENVTRYLAGLITANTVPGNFQVTISGNGAGTASIMFGLTPGQVATVMRLGGFDKAPAEDAAPPMCLTPTCTRTKHQGNHMDFAGNWWPA